MQSQTMETQLCPNPRCGADNPTNVHVCPKCGVAQRQLLGRGTVLQGRYRVDSVRGCGGFGAVYRATDLLMECPIALKENHQHRTFARFEREAKLLMDLSHPNLPKVRGVFQDAVTGRAYLVMDFVDGETLEELVRRKGALAWQDAEPIFAQIMDALTYLHRQNIVHRDIKPGNIVVQRWQEAVYEEVTDWEETVIPPPTLTEVAIQTETDKRRFERGQRLLEKQYLTDWRRDGWTLWGICWSESKRGKYYNVQADLTKDGIGSYSCECPDFQGRQLCKHLVALLLAWARQPQLFLVVGEKIERHPIKRQVLRSVERRHAVLVDFGVAKVMEAPDPTRPRSSSIQAWTDGYSPPEQYISGYEVDTRADQYALAATMVFALTGKTPLDAFTRMARFRKGEPDLPPKPENVPDEVWQAIQFALQFDPDNRFDSVESFWEVLQGEKPLTVEPPIAPSPAPSRSQAVIVPEVTFKVLEVVKGTALGVMVGAGVGGLFGILSFVVFLGWIFSGLWGAAGEFLFGATKDLAVKALWGLMGGLLGGIFWGRIAVVYIGRMQAKAFVRSIMVILGASVGAVVGITVGRHQGLKAHWGLVAGFFWQFAFFALAGAIFGAMEFASGAIKRIHRPFGGWLP